MQKNFGHNSNHYLKTNYEKPISYTNYISIPSTPIKKPETFEFMQQQHLQRAENLENPSSRQQSPFTLPRSNLSPSKPPIINPSNAHNEPQRQQQQQYNSNNNQNPSNSHNSRLITSPTSTLQSQNYFQSNYSNTTQNISNPQNNIHFNSFNSNLGQPNHQMVTEPSVNIQFQKIEQQAQAQNQFLNQKANLSQIDEDLYLLRNQMIGVMDTYKQSKIRPQNDAEILQNYDTIIKQCEVYFTNLNKNQQIKTESENQKAVEHIIVAVIEFFQYFDPKLINSANEQQPESSPRKVVSPPVIEEKIDDSDKYQISNHKLLGRNTRATTTLPSRSPNQIPDNTYQKNGQQLAPFDQLHQHIIKSSNPHPVTKTENINPNIPSTIKPVIYNLNSQTPSQQKTHINTINSFNDLQNVENSGDPYNQNNYNNYNSSNNIYRNINTNNQNNINNINNNNNNNNNNHNSNNNQPDNTHLNQNFYNSKSNVPNRNNGEKIPSIIAQPPTLMDIYKSPSKQSGGLDDYQISNQQNQFFQGRNNPSPQQIPRSGQETSISIQVSQIPQAAELSHGSGSLQNSNNNIENLKSISESQTNFASNGIYSNQNSNVMSAPGANTSNQNMTTSSTSKNFNSYQLNLKQSSNNNTESMKNSQSSFQVYNLGPDQKQANSQPYIVHHQSSRSQFFISDQYLSQTKMLSEIEKLDQKIHMYSKQQKVFEDTAMNLKTSSDLKDSNYFDSMQNISGSNNPNEKQNANSSTSSNSLSKQTPQQHFEELVYNENSLFERYLGQTLELPENSQFNSSEKSHRIYELKENLEKIFDCSNIQKTQNILSELIAELNSLPQNITAQHVHSLLSNLDGFLKILQSQSNSNSFYLFQNILQIKEFFEKINQDVPNIVHDVGNIDDTLMLDDFTINTKMQSFLEETRIMKVNQGYSKKDENELKNFIDMLTVKPSEKIPEVHVPASTKQQSSIPTPSHQHQNQREPQKRTSHTNNNQGKIQANQVQKSSTAAYEMRNKFYDLVFQFKNHLPSNHPARLMLASELYQQCNRKNIDLTKWTLFLKDKFCLA